ncbi:MAG: histidine--tRNA ligase [Bacillota bacterium]|nr:histidine--tRNA ligase [Bacillota bacterium]
MKLNKLSQRGMRDILPEEMEIRNYLLEEIKKTYTLFGFCQIETPCIEDIKNLTGNQGGENEKMIFRILKRGGKLDINNVSTVEEIIDCGLRYDLTVPLSRYFVNNMEMLINPFKSLQIGNVWRAERPQKGRFRQFLQCDIDIIGEKSNIAEIELIAATDFLLKRLDIPEYKILINDKRILIALTLSVGFKEEEIEKVLICIDKLEKIGFDNVKKELEDLKMGTTRIEHLLNILKCDDKNVSEFAKRIDCQFLDSNIITNLESIIEMSKNINGVKIEFTPTLVRGMSYYTGPVFEVKVEGYTYSVAGGGRYDEMIGLFSKNSIPACGFSIGFERIIQILKENNFRNKVSEKKVALLTNCGNDKNELLKKARELRLQGKNVSVFLKSKNYRFQKEILEKKGYDIIRIDY